MAIGLAVHRASSEFWGMKKLSTEEMARIQTAEATADWCSYLTMWADVGGGMVGAGVGMFGTPAAVVGVGLLFGGSASYLYERYICS